MVPEGGRHKRGHNSTKNINHSCAEDIHTWDGFLQHLVCVWSSWPFFLWQGVLPVASVVVLCDRAACGSCAAVLLVQCQVCGTTVGLSQAARGHVRSMRTVKGAPFLSKKSTHVVQRQVATIHGALCTMVEASSAVVSWQSFRALAKFRINTESPSIGRA